MLEGLVFDESPHSLTDASAENANLSKLRREARAVVHRHDRSVRVRVLKDWRARGSQRARHSYVSPALELYRRQWECIAAITSALLLAPKLTPVGQGIDTLELHTKQPVGAYLGARIEGLFDLAQRTKEAQPVEIAGVGFEVRPRMVKGGWLLSNAGGDVVLRVRADAAPDEAAVIVELHAAALWAHGWREAGELGRRLCAALTGLPASEVNLQVTRLDLCVDFQGWLPTGDDRQLFTTRAKRIGSYREGLLQPEWDNGEWVQSESTRVKRLAKQLERADSPEEVRRLLEVLHRPSTERATHVEYDAGRMAFTGFAFGRGGALSARLYNKSRETRVSRKQWFSAVWKRSSAFREPPGGSVNQKVRDHFDVWRMEFQLRREALKQFFFDVEGGRVRDLTAWDDCREHLDDVWQKLTSEWLRHGWRTAENRQAKSAPWKVLSKHRFAELGAVTQLERVIPEVAVEPTLGSVAGYLTTAAAQLIEMHESQQAAANGPAEVERERSLEAPDFGSVMTSVLAAAFDHVERKKNASAETVACEKAQAIKRRRAFLARKDVTPDLKRAARAASMQRYGRFEGEIVRRDETDDRQEASVRAWRAVNENAVSERLREWSANDHGLPH